MSFLRKYSCRLKPQCLFKTYSLLKSRKQTPLEANLKEMKDKIAKIQRDDYELIDCSGFQEAVERMQTNSIKSYYY